MKKKEINNMSTVYEMKEPTKTALNAIYGVDCLTEIMKSLSERMPIGKLNQNKNEMLDKIKNVIFNKPATIVFWADGTKTDVKCGHEDFDPEKGLAMAIAKKALGNIGNYYETFKTWLPEQPKAVNILKDMYRSKPKKRRR